MTLTHKDIIPILYRIKPSKKYKGIGVFALRDIKKGTILCESKKISKELFISHEEFSRLDKMTKKMMKDFCCQDKDGYYTPMDLNYLPIPRQMNHNCNGNVGFDENSNFLTIKSVKKGQELFFDYALVISNPRYKLKCLCKAVNCRKIITGNDWMNSHFRRDNYKNMSSTQRKLVKSTFGNIS